MQSTSNTGQVVVADPLGRHLLEHRKSRMGRPVASSIDARQDGIT
jgi:hypothetical protein